MTEARCKIGRDLNADGDSPAFSSSYLHYALAVLFMVNMVNMVDRSIMGVLLESIRIEMALSETRIGILNGFAFALFYALAGLSIARLSDMHDRRIVLSVSVVVWSAMTALTGTVHSFAQFFLARMGVGVGESGAIPTSNAMIADYFPPAQRPLALAIFTAGSFLGVLVGSALGGYVGQHFGWRWAFVAAGLPGLPLALLTFMTMRDPPRGGSDNRVVSEQPGLGFTLRTLLANRDFLLLILSSGFITFMLFGVIGWLPAFLMRNYHLDQTTVGLFFGIALGLGTSIGSVAGGITANMLAKRSLRWLTRFPLVLSFLLLPLYEIAWFAPTATISLIFICLVSMIGGAMLGPVLAAIQTVVPAAMRATASGLTGFSGSIIGLGGAPLVIGILSDLFARSMGSAAALQRSLAISVFAAIFVSLLLFLADRAFWRRLAPHP